MTTTECNACGSTLADRVKNKPDESELRECNFCGETKCCMCDMGDDVYCAHCEEEGDTDDEDE